MILQKIIEIIAEKLEIPPEKISPESNFDDLQVDSLDMVEIMLSIEEEFNITIEEGETVINSVEDVVEYVQKRIS